MHIKGCIYDGACSFTGSMYLHRAFNYDGWLDDDVSYYFNSIQNFKDRCFDEKMGMNVTVW